MTWLLAAALVWLVLCLVLIKRDRRRSRHTPLYFSGLESPGRRPQRRRVVREPPPLRGASQIPDAASSRASGPEVYDRETA